MPIVRGHSARVIETRTVAKTTLCKDVNILIFVLNQGIKTKQSGSIIIGNERG